QSERLQLMTLEQMTVSERLVLNIPLDISSMSEIDFDRLPGIGPSLANRIIMHRQNNGGILRLEDLVSIEGIGEKKYKNIKKYF
ncbi:MAG: helix-hairpin-helix domain-containing protein, partial [Desulfuromonadales bacterium]